MKDPDTGVEVDPDQIGEGELSEEQQIYKENILDHYKHPRNKQALSNPTVVHAAVNPSCGDTIQVALQINDGVVEEIGFEGKGCAISQASMSMLSEEIKGKNVRR